MADLDAQNGTLGGARKLFVLLREEVEQRQQAVIGLPQQVFDALRAARREPPQRRPAQQHRVGTEREPGPGQQWLTEQRAQPNNQHG